MIERPPHASLGRVVRSLWITDPAARVSGGEAPELMLPSGEMHLVFRLSGPSIRIVEKGDGASRDLGHAAVNGARYQPYIKAAAPASHAIGVQLLPGASLALLGLPADVFKGQHVQLDALWGRDAELMREQLLQAGSAADKLLCLESMLQGQLSTRDAPVVNPVVQQALVRQALAQLRSGSRVEAVVERSGYSHRQFVRLFSQAVGMSPKLYCRVQRFQKALGLMRAAHGLAEVAMEAGYSDQPHFNRDFREFSGLTPEQYLAARTTWANHVPMLSPPSKTKS